MRPITAGVLSLVALAAGASVASARTLSFEERVAAQTAMEQVHWSHRIWPKENPEPKPPLSSVMPDTAIRAKVEDYLKKSNALERWWQRPITGEQLQAELDRIVQNTRDGATLKELFNALGNDPFVIAETLARQTLVDRLIRGWYASDNRFHGALKRRAETALAGCADAACFRESGGSRSETVRKHRPGGTQSRYEPGDTVRWLDDEEWADALERVSRARSGRFGPLEESADGFFAIAVLERKDDEIKTASVVWPKRSFDAWWQAERGPVASELAASSAPFALPDAPSTACTNDTWTPTKFEVPDSRQRHTAIWTGTEMIVWGGANDGCSAPVALNSGGRYNPATDSWTPTSRGANAPVARAHHSAVWTGTSMIVWGGSDYFQSVDYNSGGRYDPASDTWTSTSTGANTPTARRAHTAVWTGTEMVVWGGAGGSASYFNTGARYNPGTDSWTVTSTGANVPAARWLHTAVWTGSRMIVWGGRNTTALLNTGGRYDPGTDSWTATSTGANVPAARAGHAAVWAGNTVNVMIVWGGHSTNTGGRYDPVGDSWLPTSIGANAPSARDYTTMVWTGTEAIVWSGDLQNSGGRYDPTFDTWSGTSTTNAPAGRVWHTAVWTGAEMIVWGGYRYDVFFQQLRLEPSGGRYNPSTNSWIPTSMGTTVPPARYQHTAVWTGAEMIVWGGEHSSNLFDTNAGGRYIPSTDSWSPTSTANSPAARTRHTAVWTGTEMIVWGGTDSSSALNNGGRYRPSSDNWTPTSIGANVPQARAHHTALWTGTEMIVWAGTDTMNNLMNTGGRYRPASNDWTATSTGANVPEARHIPSAIWTGTEMIVWGGSGATGYLNTGGRYSPSSNSWAATSTGANVPVTRAGHSAVWTGTEMIIWGGSDGSIEINTGGRYDPSANSWTPTSTAGAPSVRADHDAVWTGTEMIVWGGFKLEVFETYDAIGGRYDPSTNLWAATSGVNAPMGRGGPTAIWTGAQMIVWGGYPATSSGGLYCACPNGTNYSRDADGDGYGNAGMSGASCDGTIPSGYVADSSDCNDAAAGIHPGVSELCNGIDDNCDAVVPANEADADGDSVRVCAGDCDDTRASRYPGAPEINDGIDNQCPGDPGYGSRDEIAGVFGFLTPGNKTTLSWPSQAGATSYTIARSPYRDLHAGCSLFTSASPSLTDAAVPPPGGAFFYLVRATDPFTGSWGKRSSGSERTVCAACDSSADACDDGNPCTVGETCSGTVCGGSAPLNCNDGQVCTDDSCDPVFRCLHANNTAGCTDGNACTSGDVCGGGSCQPGGATNCDDGNACTADSCDSVLGCAHTPITCNDGNACTTDSCNPASGCVFTNNTLACDDGNACTSGDVCSGGVCAGTLPPAANHLVISQIQVEGDGGAEDEFVEIYNPTSSPISLSGKSLQYKTNAGGATYYIYAFGSESVPAHGWFLLAGAGYNGSVLADAANTNFPIAQVAGNFFLVGNTTLLSGACPVVTSTIIDKVAYGTGICPEGGAAAPQPPPNDSIIRKPGASCGNGIDTDNNAADFMIQSPATPRNRFSILQAGCETNGTSCDDGNTCTTGDVCGGGICTGAFPPAANHLVISQIQVEGDGGTEDEFVEIYNPTSAPISLSGKSLQYKTNAGGATYYLHAFGSFNLPAHRRFLLAPSTYNGPVTKDELNTSFPMAQVAGNFFLVSDTTLLSGACPVVTSTIIDKVAYGTGICPEGGAAAPQPPPNDSIIRKPEGSCGNGIDTDNNAADFMAQVPSTPRNTTSPPQP